MQRPARTRIRTRRARVSRNVRGNGFDADAGFTIVEVVVAVDAPRSSRSSPRPACSTTGTLVSGNTRQRVVAAQLATPAIEKVRGPAADPSRFTTAGPARPDRSRTQTVNGLKYTVTQDMQWVSQTVDHELVRQRRHRQQLDPPGHRIGHLAGRGRDDAGAVDHHARAAGRRVLRVDRLDRGQGARLGRAARCPDTQVSITGPTSTAQPTTAEGLRVLRVPHAGHVHRDGHRGHRCRRPGSARPEPDDVGDGRPDRVGAVQLRHRGDDHGHRLVGLDRHARDQHPDRRSRTPACSRTASSRTRPGTTTLTPLFPYPSGLHGVRRQLHRQQPAR